MKRSYLWLLVSPMLLAVACAQGEDPNVKGSGGAGGGTILGGSGGGTGGSGGLVTGGSGGGSTNADCLADGYTDPTCGTCMENKCAAACTTCLNNSDCVSWLSCAMDCPDAACEDGCSQQYPAGETAGLAWLGNSGCIGTACETECAVGSGGCGLTTSDATCDGCIASYCCTQGNTCANDQGCLDVLDCIQSCTSGDTACENSCMNSNPTGAAELNDFAECLNQMCATDCS